MIADCLVGGLVLLAILTVIAAGGELIRFLRKVHQPCPMCGYEYGPVAPEEWPEDEECEE